MPHNNLGFKRPRRQKGIENTPISEIETHRHTGKYYKFLKSNSRASLKQVAFSLVIQTYSLDGL